MVMASPRLELEEMRGEERRGEACGESRGQVARALGQGFEKLGNNFEKPSTQHSRRARRGLRLRCCASPPQRQCTALQRSSKV